MTPRAEALILTAAPCAIAIVCAGMGKAGAAYIWGGTGIATAVVTAFGRPGTDKRDEERARIGEGDA